MKILRNTGGKSTTISFSYSNWLRSGSCRWSPTPELTYECISQVMIHRTLRHRASSCQIEYLASINLRYLSTFLNCIHWPILEILLSRWEELRNGSNMDFITRRGCQHSQWTPFLCHWIAEMAVWEQ